MNRKILVGLLVLMLIPTWLFSGITGKISGYVKDQETGDALPGVNVVIQGTMMGAATDINGFYIILNVPVGTYVLRATYIGYKAVEISNIRVHPDLTTEVNFDLPPTVLEGEMVSIVAERPIINKNVTHTVKTIQAEDLKNIPMRGVETVMQLSSSVVSDGGNFYVRGGRSHEAITYVDGVMTSLLRGGDTNALNVINNAIEESNFHSGGFSAEYGFASSGVLQTTTKSGGTDYHFSLEGISDEVFQNSDGKTLGTRSWGYNTYTITASGPIPGISDNALRFFAAAERNYDGGNATFWQGIQFDTTLTSLGRTYQFNADYGPGPLPGFYRGNYNFMGNLLLNLPSIRFKVGGTYFNEKRRGSEDLANLMNIEKLGVTKEWNANAYLNITHQLNPKLFYTLNLNYFYYKSETGDPDLWDNVRLYGDPAYNIGPDGLSTRIDQGGSWGNTYYYNLFGLVDFSLPGQVVSGYGKTAQENFGPKFDLTWQFNNYNELRSGFEFNYFTIRRLGYYGTASIAQGLHQRAINPDDHRTDWDLFRNILLAYGYDMWGNEVNKDNFYWITSDAGDSVLLNAHDGPKHPIQGAFYLQDRIELKDLVLNAGIRFDYFATGTDRYKDPARLILNEAGFVGDESMESQGKYIEVSPRLGWSFPVTDQTVFHAQFGKFVQMPQMDDLYDGHSVVARFIQGGNARTMPNPNLKPQKTIQYEVGLKQQIGANASLSLTAFYRDVKDLIQLRVFWPEEGLGYASFYQLQNIDFGTTRGFTVTFNLRRTNRISAYIDYTYSKALGTGSNSTSHFDVAWQDASERYPTVLMPLAHNQDHVANFNVDVRLTKDDGPTWFNVKPLANLGLNVIYVMHSGSRYTRIVDGPRGLFAQNGPRPVESLNASVLPWYNRVDLKFDKTFTVNQFQFRPYVWIYNVFNTKNITGVYSQSGEAQDNGWFVTEDGKAWAKSNGSRGMYFANYILSGGGRTNLSTPRILRFGLLVEF